MNREQFNSAVSAWFTSTVAKLRTSADALGIDLSHELINTLKARVYKRFGVAIGGGIWLPRYGIWVERGASRGHGGVKGSRWWSNSGTTLRKRGVLAGVTVQGQWRRTNPASLGKMNTGARLAREWFNPVVDAAMDALSDICADYYGSQAEEAMLDRIRIK